MTVHPDWDDAVSGAPVGDPDPFGTAAARSGDAPLDAVAADGFDQAADDPFASVFAQELENVTASDWDVDAGALWGDDGALGLDAGSAPVDFPA